MDFSDEIYPTLIEELVDYGFIVFRSGNGEGLKIEKPNPDPVQFLGLSLPFERSPRPVAFLRTRVRSYWGAEWPGWWKNLRPWRLDGMGESDQAELEVLAELIAGAISHIVPSDRLPILVRGPVFEDEI